MSFSNLKLIKLTNNENYEEALKLTDQKTKEMLGNRLKSIAMGGAMSSNEVKQFLKRIFDFEPNDAYGTTEAGMIADSRGRIFSGVQYKIVSMNKN